MVPPIGPEVRGRILQLDALKHNIFSILYHLSLENVIVCERTVRRVLKTAKEAGTKPQQNARAAKKRKASSVRSPEVIKKIKRWTAQEDPPKQRYMARLTGVSQPTVSRIVNEDLDRVCLKKPTAPKLTDAQVTQRKVHAKPFSLLVSGGREQYILTLDEAWISLDFTNGQSPIYYAEKTKSEGTRAPPVATSAPRFCQKTLYAAGFTWRGQTGLYFIPPNTTISSEVFIKYVLEPMLTKDVPRLYGKEASKVILHMDSASSHVCPATYAWLGSHGFKYITKLQWLANSPGVSPMDFFGNGRLKTATKKRKYRTLRGLKAAAKDEWSKIPVEQFQNALSSWSKRVLEIHKAKSRSLPQ